MLNLKFYFSVLSIFYVTLSLILVQNLVAQSSGDMWSKVYGGKEYDWGNAVRLTSDEGYIIAGGTSSFGSGTQDFWIIKTNFEGDTIWTKAYGGSQVDRAYDIQKTTDNGYIVVGTTYSFGAGSNADILLIKINNLGEVLWTKTYGGGGDDQGKSVLPMSEGGYIIASESNSFIGGASNIWVIRTDSTGDTLWTKFYGGNGVELYPVIKQTTDGGFILSCQTTSFGYHYNGWLLKLNSIGDTIWTKVYGGNAGDGIRAVQETSDGGFILAGYTWSYNTGNHGDAWAIKTNSTGDILWTKSFDVNDCDEHFRSVVESSDGGYVFSGDIWYSNGDIDILLIKTDYAGNILWEKTMGGNYYEEAHDLQKTLDNGYILTGSTRSFGNGGEDVFLIKTDSLGNTILPTSIENNDIKFPEEYSLQQNYPNPFNSVTIITYSISKSDFITLNIYNMLGQKIQTLVNTYHNPGTYSVNFNANSLSTGIYYYKLKVGKSFEETRKMLLVR